MSLTKLINCVVYGHFQLLCQKQNICLSMLKSQTINNNQACHHIFIDPAFSLHNLLSGTIVDLHIPLSKN
jgi:hypothetical protein